ncbi:hypothetical protein NGB24_07140 [Mammaliicoccus vitulinus]|uniref:hypothetical protein n=1 Tax=Mammaliicoccus vitulinus TaxID=71237 RepID=UPI002DB5908C|nr:hypothetical protein [Mammaliicoccus vitulinus]MEB7657627.1 hypothetical protein [Mammaliicoccus vitulinus]
MNINIFKRTKSNNEKVYKETEFFTQSNKVMELLFKQETDLITSLTPYEELNLIKDRLESPESDEYDQLIERKTELEKIIKVKDYSHVEIPDEMKETVRVNYEKELQAAKNHKSDVLKEIKDIKEKIDLLNKELSSKNDELNKISNNISYVQYIPNILDGKKFFIKFAPKDWDESVWIEPELSFYLAAQRIKKPNGSIVYGGGKNNE